MLMAPSDQVGAAAAAVVAEAAVTAASAQVVAVAAVGEVSVRISRQVALETTFCNAQK